MRGVSEICRVSRLGPRCATKAHFERTVEARPQHVGTESDAGFLDEQVPQPSFAQSGNDRSVCERERLIDVVGNPRNGFEDSRIGSSARLTGAGETGERQALMNLTTIFGAGIECLCKRGHLRIERYHRASGIPL